MFRHSAISEADFRLAVYQELLDTKIRSRLAPLPTKFQVARKLNIGLRTAERCLADLRRDGTLIVENHAGQTLWGLQGSLRLEGGYGCGLRP